VLDPLTQHVRTTRNVVFDEDRGWNWPQEKDGNTGYNSYFVIEYLVEATVAAEESATPRVLLRLPLICLRVPRALLQVLLGVRRPPHPDCFPDTLRSYWCDSKCPRGQSEYL
jgi:hypothetical protein